MATEDPILVFFGIEISAHETDSEILQIYMKCGDREFNRFITPTKEISKEMSTVNHLTFHDSELYRDAEKIDTSPRREVLKDLHAFLKQFGRPCTLIAHKYCYNNSIRLIRAMKREMFAMKFNNVVAGFTCSLDLYVEKFPDRNIKELTIYKLKKEAGIECTKTFSTGRRIEDDARLLEQLLLLDFSAAQLAAKRSFAQELKRFERLFPDPKPSGNKYHPRVVTVIYVEGKPCPKKPSKKQLESSQKVDGDQQAGSSQKVSGDQQPNSSQKENVSQQICFSQEAGSSGQKNGSSKKTGEKRQRDFSKKTGDKRQRNSNLQAGGDRPAAGKKSKRGTKKERKEIRLQAEQARWQAAQARLQAIAQAKKKYQLDPIEVLAEMEKPKQGPHFSQVRKEDPTCLGLLLAGRKRPKSFIQSSRTRKGDPFSLIHPLSSIEAKCPSRIAKNSYFNTKL